MRVNAIGTTGTENVGLFVNKDGHVGIGTTNPLMPLTIIESGLAPENSSAGTSTHGRMVSVQGAGAAYFMGRDNTNDIEYMMGATLQEAVFAGSMTNHDFHLRTDNQNRMIINTSGNVGIGTNTPNAKLDVVGTVSANAFSGDGSALTNVPGASTAYGADASADDDSIYVTANGYVGIGTTAPAGKLHMVSSGEDTTLIIGDNDMANGYSGQLSLVSGATNREAIVNFKKRNVDSSSQIWQLGQKWNQGTDLIVRDESAGINVMTFKASSGNVGIGTTA
ncbi:MAG: hypothetical protein ABIH39_07425, partial [Candidatus Margulisiibacteriota bacterium]